jgi:hypothetical protein
MRFCCNLPFFVLCPNKNRFFEEPGILAGTAEPGRLQKQWRSPESAGTGDENSLQEP